MLLFDLGNTRIKWARSVAGALLDRGAAAWDSVDWLPQVDRFIAAHRERQARFASVTGDDRAQALTTRLDAHAVDWHQVGPAYSDTLLQLAYPQPASLGVDRWLALRAARRRISGGFVLASAGSALTVDAVDSDGGHLGGVIAPSPARAREALLARAPHLQGATGRIVAFADNTRDAVESGAWLAAAALIERQHRQAERRLPEPLTLLLTGGDAAILQGLIEPPSRIIDDLVLHGLADIATATAVNA